jgi:hypothetical protein
MAALAVRGPHPWTSLVITLTFLQFLVDTLAYRNRGRHRCAGCEVLACCLIMGAMTETESLIAEVRQLRVDVARLHAAHTAVHIRHGWLGLLLKDLSTNPYTQYKVHMWGAIYWLINFPLICALFFFTPTLWVKLGIFITLIYSIYANLATDYGAMSAAEAAFGEPPPPPIPLEPPPPLPPA